MVADLEIVELNSLQCDLYNRAKYSLLSPIEHLILRILKIILYVDTYLSAMGFSTVHQTYDGIYNFLTRLTK